jgi:hypothetical protein
MTRRGLGGFAHLSWTGGYPDKQRGHPYSCVAAVRDMRCDTTCNTRPWPDADVRLSYVSVSLLCSNNC